LINLSTHVNLKTLQENDRTPFIHTCVISVNFVRSLLIA
jgi:hypothetical protein